MQRRHSIELALRIILFGVAALIGLMTVLGDAGIDRLLTHNAFPPNAKWLLGLALLLGALAMGSRRTVAAGSVLLLGAFAVAWYLNRPAGPLKNLPFAMILIACGLVFALRRRTTLASENPER